MLSDNTVMKHYRDKNHSFLKTGFKLVMKVWFQRALEHFQKFR